jgi:hypothetical protein
MMEETMDNTEPTIWDRLGVAAVSLMLVAFLLAISAPMVAKAGATDLAKRDDGKAEIVAVDDDEDDDLQRGKKDKTGKTTKGDKSDKTGKNTGNGKDSRTGKKDKTGKTTKGDKSDKTGKNTGNGKDSRTGQNTGGKDTGSRSGASRVSRG